MRPAKLMVAALWANESGKPNILKPFLCFSVTVAQFARQRPRVGRGFRRRALWAFALHGFKYVSHRHGVNFPARHRSASRSSTVRA